MVVLPRHPDPGLRSGGRIPSCIALIYIFVLGSGLSYLPTSVQGGTQQEEQEPKVFGIDDFRGKVVRPLLEKQTTSIADLVTTYLTAIKEHFGSQKSLTEYDIEDVTVAPTNTDFWKRIPDDATGKSNFLSTVLDIHVGATSIYPLFPDNSFFSTVIQDKENLDRNGSLLVLLTRAFLCMARDMDEESVVFAGYGIPDADKTKITSKAELYNAFKGLEGGCAKETFTQNPLTEATIAKDKASEEKKGKKLFADDKSKEPQQEPEEETAPVAWVSSYFADGKETFIHAKAKGVLKAASGIAAFQRMYEVGKKKNNFLLRYSLKQHHAYSDKTLVSLFNNPKELVTFWEQKVRFQQTYTNEFPKPSSFRWFSLNLIMSDVFDQKQNNAYPTFDIGLFLNSVNAKTMTHFSKFMLETIPAGKESSVFNDARAQFLMGQSTGYPSVFFDMEKQELITTPLATKRLLLSPESRIVHMPPLFNAPLHQKMKALSADIFPEKEFDTTKEARFPFPMGSSDVLIGPGGEGVSGEDVQNALLAYSMHFVRGMHNYCQKDDAYSKAEAKTIQCMNKKLTEGGLTGANINETAVLKIAEERGIETVDKTTGEAIPIDEIVSDVVSTTPVDESCIESVTPEMGKNNICLAYHFAMTHWDEELRNKSCDGKTGWYPWHECAWSNWGSIAINVGLITLTTLLVVQLFSLAIKGKGWFWEGKKKKKKKAKAVPAVARPAVGQPAPGQAPEQKAFDEAGRIRQQELDRQRQEFVTPAPEPRRAPGDQRQPSTTTKSPKREGFRFEFEGEEE